MIYFVCDKFRSTAFRIRDAIESLGIASRIIRLDRFEKIAKARPNDLYVNWGCCNINVPENTKVLNRRPLGKVGQFNFAGEVCRVPKRWLPQDWEQIETFPVLSRSSHGHGGTDIVVIHSKEEAKKMANSHRERFFVKLIEKKSEFRVHVLGNSIAEVTRKVPIEDVKKEDEIAWNHEFGFIQREVKNNPATEQIISNMAKDAVFVCEYNFGAVDIICSTAGNFFFLEINSAPSVAVDRRVAQYANYFIGEYKKMRSK